MKKIIFFVFVFCSIILAQTSPPSGYTPNYGLRMWAAGANPSADSLNANWLLIDSKIRLAYDSATTSTILKTFGTYNLYGNYDLKGGRIVIDGGRLFFGNNTLTTPLYVGEILPTANRTYLTYTNVTNTDTLASWRYLRANYPGLSTNNTFGGNNTFMGLTSIISASIGEMAVSDGFYMTYDSLARSSNFTLNVTTAENTFLIRNTTGANINISDITGGQHGQLIMIMAHPTTVSTVTLVDGGNVKLVGDTNFIMGAYDNVTLRNYWGKWIEISRSNH